MQEKQCKEATLTIRVRHSCGRHDTGIHKFVKDSSIRYSLLNHSKRLNNFTWSEFASDLSSAELSRIRELELYTPMRRIAYTDVS